MLPGITPVIGSSKPVLAFRASSTSVGSDTITLPASVQAGDLIVLFDRSKGFSVPTKVVPTGFTEVRSDSGTNVRATYSYKIAVGGDASAVVTGQASSNQDKVALVFSASRPLTSAVVGFSGGQATDGDPTAINITASGGAAPLVVFGAWANSAAAVSPRTSSPAMDAEVTPATDFYTGYKIYNSSPADVSVDMDDEGAANSLAGFYISVN